MSESKPWKDWIPGVLSKKQIQELCQGGYIEGIQTCEKNNQIDHSSIDLTLSDEAYEMDNGSIKPFGKDYRKIILQNKEYAKEYPPIEQDENIFCLEKKHTYLFHLNEKLKNLQQTPIYGCATAKSSVGRVDVLARLIVDGMKRYEYFDPGEMLEDEVEMFLEITPITFDVRVKVGEALSQLRLFFCHPDRCRMKGKELCRCLLRREKPVEEETLSVDLTGTTIYKKDKSAYKENITAFKAKRGKKDPIDLWTKQNKQEKPDPNDYWECIEEQDNKRLKIEKDHFYILRSKERLSLPKGIAVYCRAIDESIGEMRIHYAGFAHPFFGKGRKDNEGTPLIFEVRGHNVDVNLVDDEKLARLEFYRMSEDCESDPLETQDSNGRRENELDIYNEQELELSKFFRKWGT